MKVKPEHVAHMKTVIDKFIDASGGQRAIIEKYETGKFPRSELVKDLNTRFCFDVLFESGLLPWVCQTLSVYDCNDAHVLTALKSVLPTLTRR